MGCHYLSRNQKLEYRSNPRILIPTTWELLPIASSSNSTHPPADTEDGYMKPRLTDRKKTAKFEDYDPEEPASSGEAGLFKNRKAPAG